MDLVRKKRALKKEKRRKKRVGVSERDEGASF